MTKPTNGKLWMWIAGGLLTVLAAGGGKVIDHGERLAVVEKCIQTTDKRLEEMHKDLKAIRAWVVPQPPG